MMDKYEKQYMKHEHKNYMFFQKRSAIKFCTFSILNRHELIGNRTSYDEFRFFHNIFILNKCRLIISVNRRERKRDREGEKERERERESDRNLYVCKINEKHKTPLKI